MRILRDPDPGAGGGGGFLATLPEDLRNEPSLRTVPDVPTLAKNYVNAQKLIGQKRVPAPDQSWGDQQWNEFYSAVGRPEKPELYSSSEVKLEEGLTLDEQKLNGVKQTFHKLGLTDRQAKGIMDFYLGTLNETAKSTKSTMEQESAKAIADLRGEWGEKFDVNLDLAKGAIRKFGDDGFLKFIEGSMGNNVPLIKMFSKIGSMLSEDSARGGEGFMIKDATRATQEIEQLKLDKTFMEAWSSASHPGHKAAVSRWLELHRVAYPGKQVED